MITVDGYIGKPKGILYVEVLKNINVSTLKSSALTCNMGTMASITSGGDFTVTGEIISNTNDFTSTGVLTISNDVVVTSALSNTGITTFTGDTTFTSAVRILNTATTVTVNPSLSLTSRGMNIRRIAFINLSGETLITLTGAGAKKGGIELFTMLAYSLQNAGSSQSSYPWHILSVIFRPNFSHTGNGSVTPEIGIGTALASGAASTLTGTDDDIVSSFSIGSDLDTIDSTFSYITHPLISQDGFATSSKVYLNIAATWAGSGTITVTGDIVCIMHL